MYIQPFVEAREHQTLITMANSGIEITYGEFEARTNQLAHFFRECGLQTQDHYSIFMENNERYLEACGGGERAGLYYTCINSYLKADELAFIINNSESKVLITSQSRAEIAAEALQQCPQVRVCLVVSETDRSDMQDFVSTLASFPTTPISDQALGTPMLYSSGTTGRPKGILRPLPELSPAENLPIMNFLQQLWHYKDGMRYLSPAPLYHSAPQAAVGLTLRAGGTCVIMEKFDPEQYLSLIESHQITHSQLVPTMFSRMLKLPEDVRNRYDLSSLEIAVHAAAPCPAQVKRNMIDWWGPIIFEYYGATEGLGFAACTSEEWLAHQGSVGKIMLGELHIMDDEMNEVATGDTGTVWFKTATPFEYFNDTEKSVLVDVTYIVNCGHGAVRGGRFG
ncbi:MAG: AMP-binding protein, partial [Pseudomonadota bacterium]